MANLIPWMATIISEMGTSTASVVTVVQKMSSECQGCKYNAVITILPESDINMPGCAPYASNGYRVTGPQFSQKYIVLWKRWPPSQEWSRNAKDIHNLLRMFTLCSGPHYASDSRN